MITRLSVQHFRSVDNLDLRLRSINLLVGPNGSGKSNIIDAVKFVRDAVRNGLDRALTDRHGIQSVRQWSPTRPYHVTISIELDFKDFGQVRSPLPSRLRETNTIFVAKKRRGHKPAIVTALPPAAMLIKK